MSQQHGRLSWRDLGPALTLLWGLTLSAAAAQQPSASVELVPATPRPSEVIELFGTFSTACAVLESRVEVVGRRVSLVAVEACSCSNPLQELQLILVRGAVGPLAPGAATAELVRAGETVNAGCGGREVLAERDFEVDAAGEVGRIGIEPVPLTSATPITLTLRSACPAQTSSEAPVLEGTTLRWVERYNPFILAPCFDRLLDVGQFKVGPLLPGEYRLELYTIETNALGEGEVEGPPGLVTSFVVLSPGPLVLHDRFEVRAVWSDASGARHEATPVKRTKEAGFFWFFDAGNVELVVKVLDGCGVNGSFWVFVAGLTDLGVEIVARDLVSGAARTYTSEPRAPLRPVLDIEAFEAPCGAAARPR
jgi:hypothetical protein